MSKWIIKEFCTECDYEFSQDDILFNARCPSCAHVSKYGFYPDVYKKAARWIQTAPWWQFWGQQGYWEFK